MLDVHPPHHPVHAWRDFFIHIATIVVGLLIAVGLEQTVEAVHHHREVVETREALRAERDLNQKIVADETIMFRREAAALENNLLVLEAIKQFPGTARADLPGILTWHSNLQELRPRTAWTTAQQTGVTGLMPIAEVRDTARLYQYIDILQSYANDLWDSLGPVRTFSASQPDPTRWSAAQVDSAIALAHTVQLKLYTFGAGLVLMHQTFPEFAPGFLNAEIKPMLRIQQGEADPTTAAARLKTIQRIDAAGKFPDYFPQSDGTQR